MKPVIALVGRPNVGKSTLFNRMTRARNALVADEPGLTRDRQYGFGSIHSKSFIVVDTAGIAEINDISKDDTGSAGELSDIAAAQTLQAVDDANIVLFIVDGRHGKHPYDKEIVNKLRSTEARVWLIANKAEGQDADIVSADFYDFGLGEAICISAAHGDNVNALIEEVLSDYPQDPPQQDGATERIPRIAVVGRPNVGKSTLVNTLVGEQRVVVYDEPGTTRDSIEVPFDHGSRNYVLIDTAGVRRRKNVSEKVEKFSIIKTLLAIDESNIVLLVLDASQSIADQDMSLAGVILEAGRAIVVVINKWDKADKEQRQHIYSEIDRKLPFLSFADQHNISALTGSGVKRLYKSINDAFASAFIELTTSKLNRTLEAAVEKTPPPMSKGRRIKLKFAHQGGKNPPTIIIHGNQVSSVPQNYQRYLINSFRKVFDLKGTPLRIQFSQGDNPYKDRGKRSTKKTRTTSRKRIRKKR